MVARTSSLQARHRAKYAVDVRDAVTEVSYGSPIGGSLTSDRRLAEEDELDLAARRPTRSARPSSRWRSVTTKVVDRHALVRRGRQRHERLHRAQRLEARPPTWRDVPVGDLGCWRRPSSGCDRSCRPAKSSNSRPRLGGLRRRWRRRRRGGRCRAGRLGLDGGRLRARRPEPGWARRAGRDDPVGPGEHAGPVVGREAAPARSAPDAAMGRCGARRARCQGRQPRKATPARRRRTIMSPPLPRPKKRAPRLHAPEGSAPRRLGRRPNATDSAVG